MRRPFSAWILEPCRGARAVSPPESPVLGVPSQLEVPLPQRPDFAAHRAQLLAHLAEDEAVLLFGGPHHLRNADSEYRYRADSDIYWLSAWEDPEVALFLRPGDEPFTLFCQARDPEREQWTGVRPGPEGAIAEWGADAAYPYDALAEHLPRLLQGVATLHYAFGREHQNDLLLLGAINKAAKAARHNGLGVPETFHSPRLLLHELRLRKNDEELFLLREAARITVAAHKAAMAWAAPGRFEYQVESLIDFIFRKEGGTGPGYNTIVAGGANACVLHYTSNTQELRDGDLVLIDAGCEYGYYTADVTRTFPANGKFTEPQRQIYELVLKAQLAAIDAVRAGQPYNAMHDAAVRVLTEGMVEIGLLEGEVDTLIHEETYKKYYVHGTGHWLGLDVHDVGAYGRKGESRPLEPGMLCTVEPGLYIGPEEEEAPEAFRGIGIRIEDDVLVTDGDPEILTAGVPKDVEAVEEACRSATPFTGMVSD